jgi:hypothetical protein
MFYKGKPFNEHQGDDTEGFDKILRKLEAKFKPKEKKEKKVVAKKIVKSKTKKVKSLA